MRYIRLTLALMGCYLGGVMAGLGFATFILYLTWEAALTHVVGTSLFLLGMYEWNRLQK